MKQEESGSLTSEYTKSFSHQNSMVLAQRQKSRSMEQNRKPRDKSTPYGHLIFNIFFKSTLQENTLVWLPIRVLYQDVIPSSDYFSSLRKKQAFRLKQQFVTKTLIPRTLTKYITNDSMKKESFTVTQSSSTMHP